MRKIKQVAKKSYREALTKRLAEFNNDPKKAFTGKNASAKNPIFIDNGKPIEVPEKVKLVWKENVYTIRKDITPDLKLDKVIDIGVKKVLQKRLEEFNADAKKAFANLNENPIWLNKEKRISIKKVSISGVSNTEALHYKKDHNGKFILDDLGEMQAVDFVSTGNNHHIAIYKDKDDNLHEEVVSFYEAVHRINAGIPIINKEHEKGWKFLFTMKQNEYFIFPSTDFYPNEIDLLNSENASLISSHLFRVQIIASNYYVFCHHLETKGADGILFKTKKELSGISYNFIRTPSKLNGIVKVRINHLGQIVKVGEY